MARSLHRAIQAAEADSAVEAIVLTGSGKHFCAGLDVVNVRTLADRVNAGEGSGGSLDLVLRHLQSATLAIASSRKPVVAAVNGPAAAGGLDLALACDYRVASTEARFVESYVKLGLPPLNGSPWLLSRLVGPGTALRLLLTGETLNADAALRLGLVDELCAPDEVLERAVGVASEMSAASPTLVQHIKAEVRRGRDGELGDALARGYRGALVFTESEDFLASAQRLLGNSARVPAATPAEGPGV
jgi:2-(1,2-epoxy-1,2-dihydrophenyl)acetyl-CoA isomerase